MGRALPSASGHTVNHNAASRDNRSKISAATGSQHLFLAFSALPPCAMFNVPDGRIGCFMRYQAGSTTAHATRADGRRIDVISAATSSACLRRRHGAKLLAAAGMTNRRRRASRRERAHRRRDCEFPQAWDGWRDGSGRADGLFRHGRRLLTPCHDEPSMVGGAAA